MTRSAQTLTSGAQDGATRPMPPPPGQQIWRSADVEPFRSFDYYREGICRSFMDLIPEPAGGADWAFSGGVDTMPLGEGRLVRVFATSHLVLRTPAEIARSPSECFYLNIKSRGECRIAQSGQEVVIRPGDVGLFDSTRPFALEHRREPDLAVSSFMLPHAALRERLPQGLPDRPMLMSAHPVFGSLIRETAATLASEADRLPEPDGARMLRMLVDLVAMALAGDGKARVDDRATRAAALAHAIRGYVDQHHAQEDLSAPGVAAVFGISLRYLHRLFEPTGTTFGEHLMTRRLDHVASALASRHRAHLPIATLALAAGFADPAHFHRAFKRRFGCTAGDWRRAAMHATQVSNAGGAD